MAIEQPPPDPARVRLATLVECAEKRRARADQRFLAAERERAEARSALVDAMADLAQWDKDNPDAQLPLI